MYSIDTSAVLDGWIRYYPPDVFGTVWAHLEQLGRSGQLFATEEVIVELEKKDEAAHAWSKRSLTVPPFNRWTPRSRLPSRPS